MTIIIHLGCLLGYDWDVVGTFFGGWFHNIHIICDSYIYIYVFVGSKHRFGMIEKSSEQLISDSDFGKDATRIPRSAYQFMVLTTQGSAVLAHPKVNIHMYTYISIHTSFPKPQVSLLFIKSCLFCLEISKY